jgi:outer membrane protein assembly factor BamA
MLLNWNYKIKTAGNILLFFILLFPIPAYAQQYELKSIIFQGNEEISESELSAVILSEESPWWFYKFLNSFTPLGAPAVYFDSSNIPIDLEALESYYNANGFFKARFNYRYLIDTAKNIATLIYIIEENEPSTYGNVGIYGLNPVPDYVRGYIHRTLFLISGTSITRHIFSRRPMKLWISS